MRTLFFDLDGTLTHSHVGIVRCIEHALAACGTVPPPSSRLIQYVGPPLRESFASLLGTGDDACVDRAMAAYRERFDTIGIFENVVCPGIPEALQELARVGFRLAVVTAKPTVYARRILEHFRLQQLFESVTGPELSSRGYSKHSLIRDALAVTGTTPDSVTMIGDRAEDILGARSNGVGPVAVSWGYGTRAELEEARPAVIVDSARELIEHFGLL